MKYFSTRSPGKNPLSFVSAMQQGLAADGGLFVPDHFPSFDLTLMSGCIQQPLSVSRNSLLAEMLLTPFVVDSLFSEDKLKHVCERAFTFPIPLKYLPGGHGLLELFHGPTCAFKDLGARFLAECTALTSDNAQGRQTVLVATSGDTGSAVAAAFDQMPNVRVVILYPKGKVSVRQEHLLNCWSDNVSSLAVAGDFDDCQRMVKEALSNPVLQAKYRFISANSINIARLLPQMVYYAVASLEYCTANPKAPHPGFIIPSGNLGNVAAAVMAKKCGFPIRKIRLATNSNSAIFNYFESGAWQPQPTLSTLANAMDVGAPSNFERLQFFYNKDWNQIRKELSVVRVSDAEIRETLCSAPKEWGEVVCPHTATALFGLRQIQTQAKTQAKLEQPSGSWICVATAHPAKFETIVEPLVGQAILVPPAMQALLKRKTRYTEIGVNLSDLERCLL